MTSPSLIVGIFVGGRGSRMGGVPKGLLRAPDSELTLLERLLGEVRAALGDVQVVLVGDAKSYPANDLPTVSDSPQGIGPLGGLSGLLRHAQEVGTAGALVLACDLPRIRADLLTRLATESPEAAALVAQQQGVRNPLIARYQVTNTLAAVHAVVAAGQRSLQAVLDALGQDLRLLPLTTAEAASIADWDTPEDVLR